MTTYLICMDQRMGGTHPKGGCRHYLGKSKDPAQRLEVHRAGKGARMLAAAVAKGITFDVVRTWPGDQEKALKALHNAPKLCPVHGVSA